MAGRKPDEKKLYDKTYISSVLEANAGKRFVKRIINPGAVLDLGDGKVATHRMAYGEADGRYFVYPTVVERDGELIQLKNKEAWENAMSGESIEFESEADAKWFSKNYKKVWEK